MVQTITLVNKKRGTEAQIRLDMGKAKTFRDRTMVQLSYHQCWRASRKLNPGGVGNGIKYGELGEHPVEQRPRESPGHTYKIIEDGGMYVVEIKEGK